MTDIDLPALDRYELGELIETSSAGRLLFGVRREHA
jgi:hypothetical protein